MTPDEVAAHPSVLAVRSAAFDFRPTLQLWATCAVCMRRGTARSGETARSPCGHPGACGFRLAAPPDGPHGPAPGWWDNVELRGAIEEGALSGQVPKAVVAPPPPPRCGAEWQARHDAVFAMASAHSQGWCGLPIGWAGLVELAAHALDTRGLGDACRMHQFKEKFGTARNDAAPVRRADPEAVERFLTERAERYMALRRAGDGTDGSH